MKKVLFVSHEKKYCGVHEYGLSIAEAIRKSERYSVVYAECSSAEELSAATLRTDPSAIIYNYYPTTMPWLNRDVLRQFQIPHIGIMHEVTQQEADSADNSLFDYHVAPDPTLICNNPIVFKTGRLVPTYTNELPLPKVPTIGSFGFATAGKGFERLMIAVQEEFDEAIIRLHIPSGDFAAFAAESLVQRCRALIKKKGIQLIATHQFLEKPQLLDFLAEHTLNAFFYDKCEGRGISSVIENALAVRRPIAITRSNMFRHVLSHNVFETNPSICIEGPSEQALSWGKKFYLGRKRRRYMNNGGNAVPLNWLLRPNPGLRQIIANGFAPLLPLCNEWSEHNLILDYEHILHRVLD